MVDLGLSFMIMVNYLPAPVFAPVIVFLFGYEGVLYATNREYKKH
jgi:hypothetical protein